MPCLRGPQWGLFREGGTCNNFNPGIFPLYTCVLHQNVIVYRCVDDSALFLANCHHITVEFSTLAQERHAATDHD